jgi:hypothetical protein
MGLFAYHWRGIAGGTEGSPPNAPLPVVDPPAATARRCGTRRIPAELINIEHSCVMTTSSGLPARGDGQFARDVREIEFPRAHADLTTRLSVAHNGGDAPPSRYAD